MTKGCFFGRRLVDDQSCHVWPNSLAQLVVKVSTHWCNVVVMWMVPGSTEFMVDAYAWRSLERQRLGFSGTCQTTTEKTGCF